MFVYDPSNKNIVPVHGIIADLYRYYPDYPHDYLYRYVDYQVATEYVDSSTYRILIRRLDGQMGSQDNLRILICYNINGETPWTEIVEIPNWEGTYDYVVTKNTKHILIPDTNYIVLHSPLTPEWLSYKPQYINVTREEFNRMFQTDIVVLPTSMFAFGRDPSSTDTSKIYMYHEGAGIGSPEFYNIRHPCDHLFRTQHNLELSCPYFLVASTDGYMEGTYRSEKRTIPRKVNEMECSGKYLPPECQETEFLIYDSRSTPVCAQSMHVNMPNVVGIPDRHYFYHNLNHSFRSFHRGIPWDIKIPSIVFAAQDRDSPSNFMDPALRKAGIAPRQYFREHIAPNNRDIIECGGVNGHWIDRNDMVSFKYILDIDGAASTWDATAWKLNSGSVILKPKSSWSQWFYSDYLPGVHYIELAEDFSDIRDKFLWCESHPEECKALIARAMELFQTVYSFQNVIKYTESIFLGNTIQIPIQHSRNILLDEPWKESTLLDHILYINLDRRHDRRHEFEAQANQYGIVCERFPAIEDSFGILGCTKSHQAVYRLALERGYDHVLVFEDDIEFLVTPEELRRQTTLVETCGVEFDVCMLAYHIQDLEEIPGCVDIMRVRRATTASAYIVNKHYLPTLIEHYNCTIPLLESTREHWHYANDQSWQKLQKKDMWICTVTRIGKQRDGYSDNAEKHLINEF